MLLRVGLYRVASWVKHQLTARNTGGHGVHSPSLFEWVRMVMDDKNSFYAWEQIEEVRSRMLADDRVVAFVDYGSGGLQNKGDVGRHQRCLQDASLQDRCKSRKVRDIAKGSLAKKKYAQMLARLVNWLGASHGLENGSRTADSLEHRGLTIVELGTSLGVTTAYMAAVDSRNKVITYEGCEAVAEIAKENWQSLGLNNITCHVGEIDVERLAKELQKVDVAFIDANHTYASTRAYFNMLATKVHAKSVLVVDDIHYNEEMGKAWEEICVDDRVTTTMDLYQMGLVFFDTNYWKKHYRMRI